MPVNVALILGYDALGGIVPAIRAIKAASLLPVVVLNSSGIDYSDWVPEACILRSTNVNQDHRALVDEIRNLSSRFDNRRIRVRAIVNGQDRMWLCYLDLKRAFPRAAGVPAAHILRTSVKPNFRFLLRHTKYHVPYVLLPRKVIESGRLKDFPALRNLTSKCDSVIVKPVVGASGLGVARVENNICFDRNLALAARRALDAQRRMYSDKISVNFLETGKSFRRPVNDYVLIEAYVNGVEHSMEGWASRDGTSRYLVEQKKTKRVEEPVFRDLEYLVCDVHPSKDTADCVSGLLKIVEYENSPFHIELKGSVKQGLKPIEFNPRLGGGSIGDLVSSIHTVDLRELGINAVLDQIRLKRSFVTVVVQPDKTGRVQRYNGIEDVQRHPDCVFIRKLVPEGSDIDRMDREAYLVEFCVVGKTSNAARRKANELLSRISVDIE